MSGPTVEALKAVGRALPGPVRSLLRGAWHRRGALLARRGLRRADPGLRREWEPHARPVSIVIPSYNDIPLLTACLRSIEKTCGHLDYEVLVVDDYCQPANSERLRSLEGGRVRVLFKDERGGFAVTVNQGMREARYDIVLLNSDIVALPGWIEALQLAAYTVDPAIGLVSGRLLYPDGRIQYGGTFWSRSWAPQWFAHRYGGQLATHAPSRVAGYNWGASGACLYVTREAYERLGGLDEQYWLGFEDVDYAMRAWEAGIRSYYAPRATLFHHESATRGYHQGNRELSSLRLFWAKWSHLHSSKTRGIPTREVDLVVGAHDDRLWSEHVQSLAQRLAAEGWTVRTHTVSPSEREELVVDLARHWSIKVAASPDALVPVWLSATLRGIAVHLLPGLAEHPAPATVAALAPEFEYIAPDHDTAARLQRLTSWPVSATVVPALPVAEHAQPGRGVLLITADASSDRAAIEVARAASDLEILEAPDDRAALDRIAATSPSVVIDLRPAGTALFPLAVMGSGCVLVARGARPAPLLDGLNCFLIPDGDWAMLDERLRGLLDDEEIRISVGQNGRASAVAAAAVGTAELSLAFAQIARRRA